MNKDGYTLSKQWYEFADENPELIKPTHGALWHWLIELNNRLKWKEKFGVPTENTMRMIGVKNYKTYKNTLDDLISWGFVQMVTKSANQHTANIVALVKFTEANTKASPKQVQSTVSVDKQNKQLKTSENEENPKNAPLIDFFIDVFKELYETINNVPYVANETENYSGAASIVEIYKSTQKNAVSDEDLKNEIRAFLESVIDHPDKFHRGKMTIPYLAKNFTIIVNSLKNGKHTETPRQFQKHLERMYTGTFANDPNIFYGRKDSTDNIISKPLTKSVIGPFDEPPPFPEEDIPPSFDEFSEFFVVALEGTVESARMVYDKFEGWGWKGNTGKSILSRWKDTLIEYVELLNAKNEQP